MRRLKTLERILSKAGLGSRSEARRWIHAARVTVNGRPTENPDQWIDLDRDRVFFDGRPLEERPRDYVLLHKPVGYLTTYRDPRGRPTVYDLLTGVNGFVSPVGRLDLDSSGLLLLTNDTALVEHITNPASHVPKTYRVEVPIRLEDAQLLALASGVTLSDGPTRPAATRRLHDVGGHTHFEITLTEGRYRQVRRMVEAIGTMVLTLERVAIGPLRLEGLEPGRWRALVPHEVAQLWDASASAARGTRAQRRRTRDGSRGDGGGTSYPRTGGPRPRRARTR